MINRLKAMLRTRKARNRLVWGGIAVFNTVFWSFQIGGWRGPMWVMLFSVLVWLVVVVMLRVQRWIEAGEDRGDDK